MDILLDKLKACLEGELKDSPFVNALYRYCVLNKSIPDASTLASMAKLTKNPSPQVDLHKQSLYGDLRIRRVLVKGVRKYPAEGNIYYCMPTGARSGCASTVILGRNGIGKSSFYTAIEKVACGYMNSAEYRGYSTDAEQREYLRHHYCNPDDSEIILDSKNGIHAVKLSDTVPHQIAFPAFLCMENDVKKIAQGLSSSYIASQLGIQEFLSLIQRMSSLSSRYMSSEGLFVAESDKLDNARLSSIWLHYLGSLKYSTDNKIISKLMSFSFPESLQDKDNSEKIYTVNQLIKFFNKIENLMWSGLADDPSRIDSFLAILSMKFNIATGFKEYSKITQWDDESETIYTQLQQAFSFLQNIFNSVSIREGGRCIYNYSEIAALEERHNYKEMQHEAAIHQMQIKSPLIGISKERFRNFDKVHHLLTEEYKSLIRHLSKLAQPVFDNIFSLFNGMDIQSVSLKSDEDGKSMRVVISAIDPASGNEIRDVEPRKFLNTFRFKLFCVSLKVALSICCTQFYGITFPIVIDDIFDSSDFSNRERIKGLISHIFDAYSAIANINIPLQLIFFTQDDVIGDSVYNGITESGNSGMAIYCRLFDYTEADRDDEMPEEYHGMESMRIINVTDVIKINR